MTDVLGLLVGHLVGDYVLQNDWMAREKKRTHLACFVHVAYYTAAVMLCSGWWRHDLWLGLVLLVAVPHFLIDRGGFVLWWMNRIGQRDFAKHLSPWSIIVVDNTFHLVCLWWVYLWVQASN